MPGAMAMPRPRDECQYSRPLEAHFDACPTFHPVRYVPLNTQFQPLQPVLTCRHMEVGLRTDRPGRSYYCKCAVGDAPARERLGRQIGERRTKLMQEVADGLMQVVASHSESLGLAKGRELAAVGAFDRSDAAREVAALGDLVAREMRELIDGPLQAHVEELGVKPEALVAVIEAGVRDFEANGFAGWTPPDELLGQLPADVAAFLRPPRATPAA